MERCWSRGTCFAFGQIPLLTMSLIASLLTQIGCRNFDFYVNLHQTYRRKSDIKKKLFTSAIANRRWCPSTNDGSIDRPISNANSCDCSTSGHLCCCWRCDTMPSQITERPPDVLMDAECPTDVSMDANVPPPPPPPANPYCRQESTIVST